MKYLVISWFSLALLLASCSGTETNSPTERPAVERESKLTIGYNDNLETLALIYNLSESGDFYFNKIIGPRATLAKELTAHFEEYKGHEAVAKLNKLLEDGFVDTYDVVLSLYNTSLPEYKQYAKYPSIYYENEGLTAEETQAAFDDFNASVAKFYEDANLKSRFENDYKELYQKIMDEVQSVAPSQDFVEIAEHYYGKQRDAYEIVVSAFSFNGIGRANLISYDGHRKAVQLVTSNHLMESDTINLNDLNSFTVGYADKDYFQEIGIHELIHTFFHEALKENNVNIVAINELDYLFTDSLQSDMRKQGYVDWRTCFEEHLVRIGEVKIAERMGNQTFAESYKKKCINDRGFIYFEAIENLLEEYENNRTKYKNIDEFIPEVIQGLKEKTQGQA